MRPTAQLDDDELWRRTQAGDTAAFAVVFDRYCDLIYNFVFRRTASWDTADDAVGVVFSEAWRQRQSIRLLEGSMRPWLLGVAANLVRRRWRSHERAARAMARLGQQLVIEDHAVDVIRRIDDERRLAHVLRRLDALPHDQREVLLLWVWEELSYDEIAVALGIPVGTVRSRLSRARVALGRSDGTTATRRASSGDASTRAAAMECHGEGGRQ